MMMMMMMTNMQTLFSTSFALLCCSLICSLPCFSSSCFPCNLNNCFSIREVECGFSFYLFNPTLKPNTLVSVSSPLPLSPLNRQWRRKEVIEWGPGDETIKYNEFKKYIFKPELSEDWDQEITTINPVVAVSVFISLSSSLIRRRSSIVCLT